MSKPNPVVHFEMPYKDSVRLSKFYSEAFGWQMNKLSGEMGNYVLAGTVEVDQNQMPKEPGAINGGFFEYKDEDGYRIPSVVISVDNLEESIKKVKESGGEIFGEPMDIPGIGTYIAIADTEGNRVGMLQPVSR